jgi:hypothetical protein
MLSCTSGLGRIGQQNRLEPDPDRPAGIRSSGYLRTGPLHGGVVWGKERLTVKNPAHHLPQKVLKDAAVNAISVLVAIA